LTQKEVIQIRDCLESINIVVDQIFTIIAIILKRDGMVLDETNPDRVEDIENEEEVF